MIRKYWLVLVMSLGLCACGVVKKAKLADLYDLGIDQQTLTTLSTRPPLAFTFSASPALTDSNMVWRIDNSVRIQAYIASRWAGSPAQLIQRRLVERLSQQGPILTEGYVSAVPRLQIMLLRFEQVFTPDGSTSKGCVAIQALLLKQQTVIGQHHFEKCAPASTQNAAGGAQALRLATQDLSDALAVWLNINPSLKYPS